MALPDAAVTGSRNAELYLERGSRNFWPALRLYSLAGDNGWQLLSNQYTMMLRRLMLGCDSGNVGSRTKQRLGLDLGA